jgi:hypothetical protein
VANANFITISSQATTGQIGALPRALVLVTRELVAGFTADPETGLYKINASDLAAFNAANSAKYGLLNALRLAFGQTYSFPYVYILSSATGPTTVLLDKANLRPRDWSLLTIVDRWNGAGGVADPANYFADLGVLKTWGIRSHKKLVLHTFSKEESAGVLTLPAELLLGGAINEDAGFKTIVSNSLTEIAPTFDAYDNIAIAWAAFCLNGSQISRSWGSLSDAHDFLGISADTYSAASRSTIENNSLAQYNGRKDRAGSLFVYDTQMNSEVNPPSTAQIESILAEDYIDDYVYVYVHNAVNAAGFTALPNDDAGIQTLLGLARQALQDCYDLGLILSKEDLSPDFSIGALTAKEVTQISPTWQATGIWPSGVITATIKPFGAAHYVTINILYQ